MLSPDMKQDSGKRLGYLALETPVEGQAAYTHVHEIIAELEGLGWRVERFFASRSGASKGRSPVVKLIDYILVQCRLMMDMGRLDALYVRGHFMALPSAFAAKYIFRLPVFHEINGAYEDLAVTYPWVRRIMGLVSGMQRWQFQQAAHLFPVTEGLAEWAKAEAGHSRVTVVPNAANTKVFTPDGPKFELGRPYVVFVGGLVKWHGIGTMLQALNDPRWPQDVALVIVGDGIEREAVQAEVARNPNLIWLGRKPYPEVPAILRGAMAALVPIESPQGRSDKGVLPMKLYEAMACGVPVIVSDLPGQAELVRETGAGVVIPTDRSDDLAHAVQLLNQNIPLQKNCASNGAQAIFAQHSWTQRAKILQETINSLAL